MTPAAGPDSMLWTARRAISSAGMIPPDEVMISRRAGMFRLASSSDKPVNVGGEGGAYIGRDDGRHGPLVFSQLGPDVRRDDDVSSRGAHAAGLQHVLLMNRVGAGVQQRHGDGFGRKRPQLTFSHSVRTQPDRVRDGPGRWPLPARGPPPPSGGEPEAGAADKHVVAVAVRPHVLADLEHVAETGGGDEGHPSASPFEDQVRRQRRAVNRPHDVLRPGAGLVQSRDKTPDHALDRVLRRGQRLGQETARRRAARSGPRR